jgi:hypothetical protein
MAAAPAAVARQPKRNIALILGGLFLLLIALGVGSVFALNLYQYLTVADRWAADSTLSPVAREFGVRIVEQAAMKRMMVFGPVMGFFGLVGLVLTGLGLRKK